jgi:hypothetical protein
MRYLHLALALAFVSSGAHAQQRPMTPDMSCAAARQLVNRAGAIVLSTGPYTYDRYVRDRSFCELAEILDPVWVVTRDVAQCPIGYRCQSGALDFND